MSDAFSAEITFIVTANGLAVGDALFVTNHFPWPKAIARRQRNSTHFFTSCAVVSFSHWILFDSPRALLQGDCIHASSAGRLSNHVEHYSELTNCWPPCFDPTLAGQKISHIFFRWFISSALRVLRLRGCVAIVYAPQLF